LRSKNEEEEEDILVSGWFYLDTQGNKQGPFNTSEMREWWTNGFFARDLQVKRVNDEQWGYISGRDEFKGARVKTSAFPTSSAYGYYPQQSYVPQPYVPQPQEFDPNGFHGVDQRDVERDTDDNEIEEDDDDEFRINKPSKGAAARGSYAQKAFFAALNGKYAEKPLEKEPFLRGRNIPTDRDGRMMAHYFDVEAYQDEMRRAPRKAKGPKKVSKKMAQSYKKKKEQKRVKRIMMI
jgi:hypothetical protein